MAQHDHVNKSQSTNDTMPTAMRITWRCGQLELNVMMLYVAFVLFESLELMTSAIRTFDELPCRPEPTGEGSLLSRPGGQGFLATARNDSSSRSSAVAVLRGLRGLLVRSPL